MRRAVVPLLLLTLVTACHTGAAPPRSPSPEEKATSDTAAALAAMSKTADSNLWANRAPDIQFDREFVVPDEPDVEKSACAFRASESFDYRGRLYFKGRPYAALNEFGKISWGDVVVDEGKLFANASLNTDHAQLAAEVHLPELPLYAVGPIVRGEYLQIHSTRIATRTSVKGAFFSPDIQLPSNLRLKTPLREDYRIPCAYVDPNPPNEPVAKFEGSFSSLNAPDKIVGISLTPDGPPVAEIVHPDNLEVGVLGMYKTTALVSVNASSEWSSVTLVGWIHEGTLDDEGGGAGFGNVRGREQRDHRVLMECESASIFVTVEKKLYRLVEVRDPMTFQGAFAENGDLRVDLHGSDTWSATTPSANTKGSEKDLPLDPFIPKEFLARCHAR